MIPNQPSSPVCYADPEDFQPSTDGALPILIVGAGAVGGYLGGRLQEAGADVTFLVRDEQRRQRLNEHGLRIRSPLGDVHLQPRVITPERAAADYTCIVLACKAYDLEAAINTIVPFIGERSFLLPLLNGIDHLDSLDQRFGRGRVLGGLAHLAVEREREGEIRHLNDFHRLVFGSRYEAQRNVSERLAAVLAQTSLECRHSPAIEQDLWNKFVFLATLAGATCLFRGPIGMILQSAGGERFIQGLLEECITVAETAGYRPPENTLVEYRNLLSDRTTAYTASMLRDIEAGRRTEADHILGDMLARAERDGLAGDCLRLAYSHLQVYEKRRQS